MEVVLHVMHAAKLQFYFMLSVVRLPAADAEEHGWCVQGSERGRGLPRRCPARVGGPWRQPAPTVPAARRLGALLSCEPQVEICASWVVPRATQYNCSTAGVLQLMNHEPHPDAGAVYAPAASV